MGCNGYIHIVLVVCGCINGGGLNLMHESISCIFYLLYMGRALDNQLSGATCNQVHMITSLDCLCIKYLIKIKNNELKPHSLIGNSLKRPFFRLS